MMSLKNKRGLLEVAQPRYLEANKAEKQKILDEFTAATIRIKSPHGLNTTALVNLLKNQIPVHRRRMTWIHGN